MTETSMGDYAATNRLLRSEDPDTRKPVYRREGFEGIKSLAHMEEDLQAAFRREREAQGLTRADAAQLVGLATPVYRRYEVAASKMNVTRAVHLAEVLGCDLDEMLYAAAPHLYGDTAKEAALTMKLLKRLRTLEPDIISALATIVEKLPPKDDAGPA